MSSVFKSTGIVAASTLMSRIMGFVREMLFANYFGASGSTDAFFVAFRIPNLLRRFVAEGALTISFIPVYTEYLVNKGESEALKLAQKVFTLLIIILIFLVILGEFFAPEIVSLFGFGFKDVTDINLAVSLTRIMFPYIFLVSLVAYAMGVLNSHNKFFTPAISPVLLNIFIVFGILFLSDFFTEPLYGVAVGVLVGGVVQVIVQIPSMIKTGYRLKISFDPKHPGIQKIFKMITPALFGMAVYQINILINTILASLLPSGSISYLYYSDRLTEVVQGVFIVSIGNVLLPAMSKVTALNDFSKLKDMYTKSLRFALFLAVPAGVALIAIGIPIISVLFLRGKFTSIDLQNTYRALMFASIGIGSVAVLRVTTPTFYSLKDTKTPVIAATISLFVNISFGYYLMHTSLLHAGLALASTIAATVQMLVLVFFLQKKTGKLDLKSLFIFLVKVLISSAVMFALLFYLSSYVNWLEDFLFKRILFLVLMVFVGALSYGLSAYILKVEEMKFIVNKVLRRG